MEGAELNFLAAFPGGLRHAPLHFARGFVGERQPKDLLAREIRLRFQKVPNALRDDARLARARARHNQQRPFAMQHSGALLRVQMLDRTCPVLNVKQFRHFVVNSHPSRFRRSVVQFGWEFLYGTRDSTFISLYATRHLGSRACPLCISLKAVAGYPRDSCAFCRWGFCFGGSGLAMVGYRLRDSGRHFLARYRSCFSGLSATSVSTR